MTLTLLNAILKNNTINIDNLSFIKVKKVLCMKMWRKKPTELMELFAKHNSEENIIQVLENYYKSIIKS